MHNGHLFTALRNLKIICDDFTALLVHSLAIECHVHVHVNQP